MPSLKLSKIEKQIVAITFILIMIFIFHGWVFDRSNFRGDAIQSRLRSHQIMEHYKRTGEPAYWNPYIFSGMPCYWKGIQFGKDKTFLAVLVLTGIFYFYIKITPRIFGRFWHSKIFHTLLFTSYLILMLTAWWHA